MIVNKSVIIIYATFIFCKFLFVFQSATLSLITICGLVFLLLFFVCSVSVVVTFFTYASSQTT